MRHEQDPDRTRLDPFPAAEPQPGQYPAAPQNPVPQNPEPPPRTNAPYDDEVVEEGVANPDYRRIRAVGIVCTLINVVTILFAIVLAVHILLVLGSANMANDFAAFVEGWASSITLGLTGLFTPDNAKLTVLFNEGLAALLWLAIGALLTYLIRRFALPGPRRLQRYRRVVR